MYGPDLRARFVQLSFALSLVPLTGLAVGCGSDTASDTGGSTSGANNSDDDNDDDSSPSKTADAGKDAGKKDAGTSSTATTHPDASKSNPSPGTGKSDAGSSASGGKDAAAASSGSGSSSTWCDALPVFQDACGSCHGSTPVAGAPMSLVTFDDFVADAPVTKGKKVYEVIETRVHASKNPMPPTGALSSDKLAKIDAWINGGAEAGDDPTCAGDKGTGGSSGGGDDTAAQAPWPPAGCDATYKLVAGSNGQKASIPAGQETHPQFTIDPPWGNDDVQALGFKPITDNPKVLHHWILYADGLTFVTGWAPGQDATVRKPLPDDVGAYLPKGAGSLRLDVHYNNLQGTTMEQDASGTEVCITKNKRQFTSTTYMGFLGIPIIPAGQELDTVGNCAVSVTQPVFLLSESPHAHKLCTHAKFEVMRDGMDIVLHDKPFAFDAQVATPLPQPFELKNGDQVITTCHYKNDTDQLVTFGENTEDEMCFNFASYYPMGALSCGGGGGLGALGGVGGLSGFGF